MSAETSRERLLGALLILPLPLARAATLVAIVGVLVFVLGTAPTVAPDAAAGSETTAADSADGVAVPAARFEVGIATTSDWTQVRIAPGSFVAHRVVEAPTGVTVQPRSDGWYILNPTTERVDVTVEAVLSEFSGAGTFAVNVTKGWVGATYTEVTNTTSTRVVVAKVYNNRRSVTDPSNKVGINVTRDELLGTERLALPHADDRKLVLAFYYPWFTTYDQPKLTDRPADPRSTARFADVLSMTQQARGHGVDGFIVSWAGEEQDGPAFDRAHEAARQTGGLVTGYLETRATDLEGSLRLKQLFEWTEQLATRADGSFLRDATGTPVIFVWQMQEIPSWGWRLILDELERRGTPVRFVGDTIHPEYAAVAWGVHRYDPLGDVGDRAASSQYREAALRGEALLGTGPPRLHVGGVAPGFDDHLIRDGNPVIERGANGERYAATWRSALSGDPDWVTVTSWNEWFEGTSIEPGVTAGDLALRQTADLTADWRG